MAVDLFAGSGGATAAFRGRPGWRVVSVELDRGRRPDICADVRRLPLRPPVDFLWASPPCTEFSTANPRNRARRPSLELIHATLEAVAELRPRFWAMENVVGAIPYLGIPVQKVGPWCLWGYFPPLLVSYAAQTHRKGAFNTAAARAAVPRSLSEAVFQAVERWWDSGALLDLRPFRRHRHKAARPGPAAPTLWPSGAAPSLDTPR